MKKILLILFLFSFAPFVSAKELIPNGRSGILIEANSGKIIYEKDKDLEYSVASMTKMVAQIIILEEIEKGTIKWSDVVTVSSNASGMGGSQIYLEVGEKISVEDLMKGISVASGNDATVAMAEYISGTEEKFVERMNQKVKELGLKHTHFVNSTGLDEKDHYSSSYDMAMIARDLVVNHSEILRFSSIYEDYLRENTSRKFWLVNTNKLLRQYDGVDGLKTGHTDDALYCLATTAKRDQLRLIGIVLGEKDSKVRNQEMIELLDYGFSNVKLKILKKKGEVIQTIPLSKTDKRDISLLLKDDLTVIEDVDDKNRKYQYKVVVSNIKYPIKKNEKIGKIFVTNNNQEISSGLLIANQDVKKLKYYELFIESIKKIVYGNYLM
ncbi:MAG: D-alanyl-D-alanine carboxypeptidase [Bacilli bacterium]|nr:D-alanyl-D-alanine carboxypeptidase [Bacilli bacterium]